MIILEERLLPEVYFSRVDGLGVDPATLAVDISKIIFLGTQIQGENLAKMLCYHNLFTKFIPVTTYCMHSFSFFTKSDISVYRKDLANVSYSLKTS
jgi:hypothetical protein